MGRDNLKEMKNWTLKDFEEELRRSEEKNKSISLEQDDALVRKARFMEARNTYERISEVEREQSFFKFRNFVGLNEKFTFFWITRSPFSQWFKCNFTTNFINIKEPKNSIDNANHCFTSAEQYMMYSKAMLFLDRDIASKILKTNDVKKIKRLGREVKFFEEVVWEFNRVKIIYEGNKAKFTQNEDLKKELFSTKGTTLVEAAPNDNIWGIGLAEDDHRSRMRKTWLGKNLLGEILTQLRFDLMGEY
ncbi:hypothetical protein GCM10011506_15870 [Marivirga lumbricoides]|uniref:NADAR domain-containing protein n=1 Tax=Marivirga lumbricoides TaxID=1046115 RepID=A0ABQ1LYF6_9BACT|nr:hypothetical protein GCM10011506_15870 [Marivirga lumbricoides]